MRLQGYIIKHISHDNEIYVFKYSSSSNHAKPRHNLTVPLEYNGLFQFCINDGYKEFMSRAPKYCNTYKNFAGANHMISEDEENSTTSISTTSNVKLWECTIPNDEPPLKIRDAPHKTRELVSGKTRDDYPIPIPPARFLLQLNPLLSHHTFVPILILLHFSITKPLLLIDRSSFVFSPSTRNLDTLASPHLKQWPAGC